MSTPGEEPKAGTGWAEVASWLRASGFEPHERSELPGDVSPRRYARLRDRGGASAILATYPPEVRGACPRFLHTTRLLAAAGVRVPAVLASDCERGWMLLEDLGPQTLAESSALPADELAACFADAAEQAGRIGRLPRGEAEELNPPLDRALMLRELSQTWELVLRPRGLSGELAEELERGLAELCTRLAASPPAVCHRDFMARNLIPVAPGRVAVLDHQDLRLGPPAYDLASLLNDTLFPSATLEQSLLAASLGAEVSREQYHRAAAQRTLKAVGTYASFARRGVSRHVPLIAPTLERSLHHLSCLGETRDLVPALRTSLAAPLI